MEKNKISKYVDDFEVCPEPVFNIISEKLNKLTTNDFETAVNVARQLYSQGKVCSKVSSEIVTLLLNIKIPSVWKLTFFLEINWFTDSQWSDFSEQVIKQSCNELEDFRSIHALCTKVFRRMGGKALARYQVHSEVILNLRSRLRAFMPKVDMKRSAFDNLKTQQAQRIVCVISTWPQKTDSTHMGIVYLLKDLVEKASDRNEFHLVVSGESEIYSPFGRLTALTSDVSQEQFKHWQKEGGKVSNLFVNLDLDSDLNTRNVKLVNALNHIHNINPSVIVYVGGPYESFLTREILFDAYPTCIVPTSINGTPGGHFDGVMATSKEADQKLSAKFSHATFRVPKPFRLFQNNDEYNGWFPNVSKDNTIVATVLGGNRIEKNLKALSKKELEGISNIFVQNPKLIWILVGKTNMQEISKLSNLFSSLVESGQIVYLEYITEIRSFFRRLDIFFVMPGMTGGGQGAQAAMFENVAVICPTFCDVGGVVPELGKYNSIEECKTIFDLLNSEKELLLYKSDCKASVEKQGVNSVAEKWGDAFKSIQSRATNRLGSAIKKQSS